MSIERKWFDYEDDTRKVVGPNGQKYDSPFDTVEAVNIVLAELYDRIDANEYTINQYQAAERERSTREANRHNLKALTPNDTVNHPAHYTRHPSGIECIDIIEHMPFNIGAAMKYLWRHGLKGDLGNAVEDLRKAIWYIERQIGLKYPTKKG